MYVVACESGKYGKDCNYTCGNCKSNSACDHVTGECTGCAAGYHGSLCMTGKRCFILPYDRFQ